MSARQMRYNRPERYRITSQIGVPSWLVDVVRVCVAVYVVVVGCRLMASGTTYPKKNPFALWEKCVVTSLAALVVLESVAELRWRDRGGGGEGESTHFHPLLLFLAHTVFVACLVLAIWSWSVAVGEILGAALAIMGLVAVSYTTHLLYVRGRTRNDRT